MTRRRLKIDAYEITRIGDISWVEISSCIGNVEKNDVLDLLEDLADEPCGGVICRLGRAIC